MITGAIYFNNDVDILSWPQLFLLFNLPRASETILSVIFAKTKFSGHAAERYCEKCFFESGIDRESFGPMLVKKSLKPSAISTDPERIYHY